MSVKTYVNKDGVLYYNNQRITCNEEHSIAIEDIIKGKASQVVYNNIRSESDVITGTRLEGITFKGIRIPLTKENQLGLIFIKEVFNQFAHEHIIFYVDTGDKIKLLRPEFNELLYDFTITRNSLFFETD